jgi:UV DNA damage endonuclease
VNRLEWEKEFEERFDAIGKKIEDSGMSVSMHPGQYTVLDSPKEDVAERVVKDLDYHEKFPSAPGTGVSNKIILHLGGAYGDKKNAMKRFDGNYIRLNRRILERLVLENDDRSHTMEEALEAAVKRGIPVVHDNLHNEVNRG